MRGSGTTTSREAAVHWAEGDLFTLPHLGDLPPVRAWLSTDSQAVRI